MDAHLDPAQAVDTPHRFVSLTVLAARNGPRVSLCSFTRPQFFYGKKTEKKDRSKEAALDQESSRKICTQQTETLRLLFW